MRSPSPPCLSDADVDGTSDEEIEAGPFKMIRPLNKRAKPLFVPDSDGE